MSKIVSEGLGGSANKLSGYVSEIVTNSNNIKNLKNDLLTNYWKGADSNSWKSKINEVLKELETMYKDMNEYANYLNSISNVYDVLSSEYSKPIIK